MANNYKSATKEKRAEAARVMNASQQKKCHAVIHTAAAASGAAGIIPIPVADAIPISAAQITMVFGLGKIFDQKITEAVAKGLISTAASTFVGRNLVKFIPVVGWGISAAVAAGVTEAIGWTIAVDFAKDAKNSWEKEHNFNDVDAEPEEVKAESESERSKIDKIIDSLDERATLFLSGEKNASTDKAEYEELNQDFEKVLDYIDECHPLRQMYDDLVLLGL